MHLNSFWSNLAVSALSLVDLSSITFGQAEYVPICISYKLLQVIMLLKDAIFVSIRDYNTGLSSKIHN